MQRFKSSLKPFYLIGLSILLLFVGACSRDNSIRVGATTTLEDSGILAMLVSEFKKDYDISVKTLIAGSGQIHNLIERGDIDSAITHDPAGEKALLEKGLIKTPIPLVRNDFLLAGPNNDPAHIQHSLTPDEAFEKIANAGHPLVSRNDQSGTHQMEMVWRNKGYNAIKEEQLIKTGTGMGESLSVAVERKAYILVDRGTWVNFANKKGLKALFEDPEFLPNQYSLLSLNKELASSKSASVAQWEEWISKGRGLTLLKNYRLRNQHIFNQE